MSENQTPPNNGALRPQQPRRPQQHPQNPASQPAQHKPSQPQQPQQPPQAAQNPNRAKQPPRVPPLKKEGTVPPRDQRGNLPPQTPAPTPHMPPMPTMPVIPPESEFSATISPTLPPAAASGGMSIVENPERRLSLRKMLVELVESGGSDLHLAVNSTPMIRLNGKMIPLENHEILTNEVLKESLYSEISDRQIKRYEEHFELDFALSLSTGDRFRGNMFKQQGRVGAVFRAIPSNIVPLEKLGTPKILQKFAQYPRGLVLMTGPTGSGKSTTLAGIIDVINRNRHDHIMTIEDPVEFVHKHRSCIVNQREVGQDTESFAAALKHVLRQDPDVILVGELRDLETISIALTAAETGHLVFATLHTQSAQDSVNRLIDVFPAGQQSQIRSQLAGTLKAVISQTLVPTIDGKGRIPACEIMIVTPAISNMIRSDEIHQIPQALQSGVDFGMQTLNHHLAELVYLNKINHSTAKTLATNEKDLENLIAGFVQRSGGALRIDPLEEADPNDPFGNSSI